MKRSSQGGFTIAELLIVIALIGVLLTFVMANFQAGRRTNDLRQAGTELSQQFRQAQGYSIGGNSIRFCSAASPNQYHSCADDTTCGVGGQCVLAVPAGGYGISISTPDNYYVFGDKNSTTAVPSRIFNDITDDYVVKWMDLSYRSLHLTQFKFDSQPAVIPSVTNKLDVTFEPPVGTVHFYLNGATAADSTGQLYTTLKILVTSDYVSNGCRQVLINRISGQISESQTSCSL
ncbi:MAG: prepilin-type N-terminal cleavage/methylation domain-containing protein [Patescibacteria group bacterium]